MAYLGKEYKFVSENNFEAFLKAIEIPAEQIAKFRGFKPTSKLEKDGDTYIHTSTTPDGSKVVKFNSGVEFDDIVHGVLPIKTTCTVDGNTVTQLIKSDKGHGTFKREYDGDTMKVTNDKCHKSPIVCDGTSRAGHATLPVTCAQVAHRDITACTVLLPDPRQ